MNEHDDRLLDLCLQELHGQRPPDLSARVLLALQEPPRGPLPQLAGPAGRRRPAARLAALLAAAVLLGFVVAVVGRELGAPAVVHRQAAAVAIDVLAGEVECVEAGRVRTLRPAPGAAAGPFAAAPGDRLRTAAPSSFRLEPFGLLVAAGHTEMEVRSMEVTAKHGVVAASSLTLAVVAGVVTWHSLTRAETAAAGETLRMEAATTADGAALLAENEQLRRRLAELQGQNDALRSQQGERDLVEPPPPPPPPAAEAPAEPAVAPLAFSDPKFADALAKIDWSTMGAVSNEMAPILAELAAAMAKEGAEMPMALAIKLQQLNSKLAGQVPALLEAGIPGFGPNGSYTHPLVVANTLASALAVAGQALTPAQKAQIEGLVRSFTVENQAIADGSHELPLAQLLAESEMKDRFYREVGSLLAPDQHGTLYPEGATDFEGTSLFSTGVLMRGHAQPVPAKDAADFARIVSGRLGERLGLDEAATAKVRAVLAQHAGAPELWRDRASPVETSAVHFLRTGRTQAALRSQLAWMREIQRQVPLSPQQQQQLAAMTQVLVPLPR